jgi:Na+/proline symporter
MHWGRIVGLAIALEAMLFVTLVPLQTRLDLRAWFVAVTIGCVLFGYIAGRLAARGLTARAALHGLLVGVLATIIYLVLCMLGPGGLSAAVDLYGAPLYVLLNALRIVACVTGAIRSTKGIAHTAKTSTVR